MAIDLPRRLQRDEEPLRVPPDGMPEPDLPPSGRKVAERRYLRPSANRPAETLGARLWQIADAVAEGSRPHESEESIARLRREYYLGLVRQELLPDSRLLAQLGREADAPFVPSFAMSLPERPLDVLDSARRIAAAQQAGASVSLAFSSGCQEAVAAEHPSAVECLEALDAILAPLRGADRVGPLHVATLRVDHPQILRFLDARAELGGAARQAFEALAPYLGPEQHAVLRRSLLGERLTGFSLRVALTDGFMHAVARGDDFELRHPTTGGVVGTLDARSVFRRIAERCHQAGEPGVVFVDRLNAGPANPVPASGRVDGAGPSGGQPLYANEPCVTASVNLSRMVRPLATRAAYVDLSGLVNGSSNGHANGHRGFSRHPAVDWERLSKTVRLGVRFLDDLLSVLSYADPSVEAIARANRRVGLGVTGWANLLIQLQVAYDSQEALDLAQEVMRFVNEAAHDESASLAQARGAFPNWERSIHRDGRPLRNAALTTIAPLGAANVVAGCAGGIEPLGSIVLERRAAPTDPVRFELDPPLEGAARRDEFWTEQLAEQIRRHGGVRGLDAVPERWQRIYATAGDIAPEWHVRMQAAFQRHTDGGLAKTIYLPCETTVDDVERVLTLAYEQGCHTAIVFRADCGSELPASVAAAPAAAGPLDGSARQIRQRPTVLGGLTFRQESPAGAVFVTINADEQGGPYELFVTPDRGTAEEVALSRAVGELACLALELPSGLDRRRLLAVIAERLQRIGSRTAEAGHDRAGSVPDAIARAVTLYIDRDLPPAADSPEAQAVPSAQLALPLIPSLGACPDCSSELVFEEGGMSCQGCGFSRS